MLRERRGLVGETWFPTRERAEGERGGGLSAEPYAEMTGVGRPVALAATLEPLSRLVAFSRAIAAEQASQRMLRVASRELTLMLNGEASLVSQLEDGLLREVADYSCSEHQVARGLSRKASLRTSSGGR